MSIPAGPWRFRTRFDLSRSRSLALLAAAYLLMMGLVVALDLPPRKDELHFWPTTLLFSQRWIPPLGLFRDYPELNYPLPFVVFGWLEHAFHLGISAGRVLNLALSFVVVAAVVVEGDSRRASNLAALGLLLFPYYLGISAHLYTDILGILPMVIGLWLHVRRQRAAAACAFALAIASRQLIVAAPAAVAAWELIVNPSAWRRHAGRWLAPCLACATLLGWLWLFGGPAPASELAAQGIHPNLLRDVGLSRALYTLTIVGGFYVLPEWVLLGRRPTGRRPATLAAVGAAMIAAFWIFPPLGDGVDGVYTIGFFDIAMVSLLGFRIRMAVYGLLAALAVLRFDRPTLAATLVYANAFVLMLDPRMWEKHIMPLMVALWYLAAQGDGRQPAAATRPA